MPTNVDANCLLNLGARCVGEITFQPVDDRRDKLVLEVLRRARESE